MGMFSNLSETKLGFDEAIFFAPNEYIVKIKEAKQITNRKEVAMIIVSAKVLAKKEDNNEKPNPGDTGQWVQKITGIEPSIWQSAWMGFLCSIYECSPDEFSDEEWETITEQALEENALKGTILKLKTYENEKSTFTIHKWQGAPTEKDWDLYDLVSED